VSAQLDVEFLVVGAGVSGLGFANWIRAAAVARGRSEPSLVVVERENEPGGYCRTVVQDGFVWDYSGHFFHFRHPEIEAWLRARMPGVDVRTVVKESLIRYRGRDIDFPFQKNIHQLERDDFIDCLVSLYFRDEEAGPDDGSFQSMLYRRFGRGIAERFLVPYNEKLYATGLEGLDRDAMGRFFPQADIADIIRNMRDPDNRSYNSTFTYPAGGAIEYIRALERDLPAQAVSLGESVIEIDTEARVATTNRRTIRYRDLVSSAPLPALLRMVGRAADAEGFTSNRVLVFNLGFDRKGRSDVHWMYFPERDLRFYRVGFYDNILDGDRMSLYVEIGAPAGAALDIEDERTRVLADLERVGIVRDHVLLSWHSVVLDPAYAHISKDSEERSAALRQALASQGVHSVGRYGRWTYCSIEDNLVETRDLAAAIAAERWADPS